MSRLTRIVPVVLALLVASSWPATAQDPDRTGWWSTAPTDLSAAPTSTPPDGLHLANGPNGQLAFAALSYHLPPYSSATLTLHLAANSLVGTPAVIACPTRSDTWPAGGNQTRTTAPAYTCPGRSAPGLLGSDAAGTTLSFLLDANQELSPGVVSLALVPATTAAPFSFDLVKPGPTALVTQPVGAAPPPVAVAPAAPSTAAPAAGTEPHSQPAQALPDLPYDAAVPPVVAPVGVPPVLAPVAVVAVPLPRLVTVPPHLVLSAEQRRLRADSRARQVVLLVLIALVGGAGYLLGHTTEVPLRLLGGRAARMDPDAPVLPGPDAPTGGLGRFARPRTGPARKLT